MWRNITRHISNKKVKPKCDEIQKDKIQIQHNTKRQKTNMTKYIQVLPRQKSDKTEKGKIQM